MKNENVKDAQDIPVLCSLVSSNAMNSLIKKSNFIHPSVYLEPWLVPKNEKNASQHRQRPPVGSSDRVCDAGIFIDILCC